MSSSRIPRLAALALGAAVCLGLALLPGDDARADDVIAGLNEPASAELSDQMYEDQMLAASPEQVSFEEGGGEGLVPDAAIKAEPYETTNGFKGWKVHVPDGKPLATPAVADGIVYVGGGFGTYDFYAFDADDGDLAWQYHVGDDGPTAAIVHNGRVAFNTESCILYVLDAKKGDKIWGQWLGDPLMAQPAAAGDKSISPIPAATASTTSPAGRWRTAARSGTNRSSARSSPRRSSTAAPSSARRWRGRSTTSTPTPAS